MKPVFAELHVFDDTEPRSAAINMAIDEALLERTSSPSLRFYRWAKPSLSFGYFGSFSDVAEHEEKREIVRRWTGGGIVFHGSDLTYSVILPSRNGLRLPSSRFIYSEVHGAIRRVLADPFVRLAARDAPKVSDACFANAVFADVLVNGRKIAGAAQRRSRAGLLHQGSIQYEKLPPDFSRAFGSELCAHPISDFVSAEIQQRAKQLAVERYGTAAWLRRR